MPDYKNAKIYRLICNTTGLQYIGSTCDTLSSRKSKHKWDANNSTKHTKSTEIVLKDDFDIILIEAYPCSNIEELRSRERYHIENTECVNKKIPNRTRQEWYQDTKETRLEKSREYRKHRREEERAYQNTKYTCETCGGRYGRTHKQRHFKSKNHLDWVKANENIQS